MNFLNNSLWRLSILTALLCALRHSGIFERANLALERLIPVGYEDELGFHFGWQSEINFRGANERFNQ